MSKLRNVEKVWSDYLNGPTQKEAFCRAIQADRKHTGEVIKERLDWLDHASVDYQIDEIVAPPETTRERLGRALYGSMNTIGWANTSENTRENYRNAAAAVLAEQGKILEEMDE